MIFQDKSNLLSLYNAVNQSSYTTADSLTVTTLADAIYIGMKNDISFLISDTLQLYEHQSSKNPNMPLRGLFYLSKIYQNYIKQTRANLYSSSLIPLPFPQYVVFYNGKDNEPDYQEQKLSNAFAACSARFPPCLEFTAVVLNINIGHNRELLDRCRILWEYSSFIGYIREFIQKGLEISEAAEHAVRQCLKQNILKDFLEKNQTEVVEVILTEFDRELYEEDLRKQSENRGIKIGTERLLKLYQILSDCGLESEWKRAVSDASFLEALFTKYGL